ncbi:MAG: DUF1737 domain-containing protein [Candidatus Competibacterales bacterium]
MAQRPPDNRPLYRLLTGSDDAYFCQRVSEALEMGYELYGPPVVVASDQRLRVAQAVVWPRAPGPLAVNG